MLVTYVRSSSYNNYDFCQMQYFLTYVLGWQSDSGKKADMGTMAHKVMEILAGLKKFQQDNPRKKWLEIEDDKCGKIRVSKDVITGVNAYMRGNQTILANFYMTTR